MSDLIDRQALIEQYSGNLLTAKTDYAKGCRDIIEDIKAAPTVEKRKHGHWIMEDAANATFNGRRTQWKKWRCSVCNITNGNRRPDYCPHCGGKMDEVSKDE